MSQSALQRMAERSRACFWKMRCASDCGGDRSSLPDWGDQQYHGAAWMDEPGAQCGLLPPVVCRCLKGTVGARRAKHRELVGKASGV